MTELITRPATSHSDSARRSTPLSVVDVVGIAGLGAIIAIHTSELSGKVQETAYLGFGYMLLIAACVTAIVMIAQRDSRGWGLAGLAAASAIVGFVLTRTTGLPGANGDIGNWGETLGIWSVSAEALVSMLTIAALRHRHPTHLGHA